MIATLLVVGACAPDTDPRHRQDVRADFVDLPKAYPIVLVDDVAAAATWCATNRDPVVIAYTAAFADYWLDDPNPLSMYGREVVISHDPSGLHLLDASERLGCSVPLPLAQPSGLAFLTHLLKTATTPRG